MVRVLELLDWIRQRKSERREGARANGEGREGSLICWFRCSIFSLPTPTDLLGRAMNTWASVRCRVDGILRVNSSNLVLSR